MAQSRRAHQILAHPPARSKATDLARQFGLLLEAHYAQRWSVQDYAARLGYAEKTLTRACIEVGRTAKALGDARVVLEAKRLLAHTDESVDAIGQRLGFADATNFIRFFKRTAGVTPVVFRGDL